MPGLPERQIEKAQAKHKANAKKKSTTAGPTAEVAVAEVDGVVYHQAVNQGAEPMQRSQAEGLRIQQKAAMKHSSSLQQSRIVSNNKGFERQNNVNLKVARNREKRNPPNQKQSQSSEETKRGRESC